MPESEKKRRSGRAKSEEREAAPEKPVKRKKAAAAAEPEEHLRSPWGPLIWLLVPLFASVAYGLATRGH